MFAVPPKFIKRPQDKTANENQDLEFECEIRGKPEPKVTWLKNGERINFSEYWQLASGCVGIFFSFLDLVYYNNSTKFF